MYRSLLGRVAKRESGSRPSCGIVSIRTRGVNRRREVVIELTRSFVVYKTDAPELVDLFPTTDAPWRVPPPETA